MITCKVKTEQTLEKVVHNQTQNRNSVYAKGAELLRGMLTQG